MDLLIGMSSRPTSSPPQQRRLPVILSGAKAMASSPPPPVWTTHKVSVYIHDKAAPLDTSLAFLNAPELSRDAVPEWLLNLETHVNQQIHAMSSLIRGRQQ